MLDIRLLGRFAPSLDGEPVEIPSRPAQSLFAYLALHPGVPYRREKLAGMLWPESEEVNARGNLRRALWLLRKHLGDDRFATDNFSIAFDAASEHRIDVSTLSTPAGEFASPDDLMEAVGLYEGELLPGFYDDWVQPERERVQAIFDDRIEHLLDRLLNESRWREAVEWGERWIGLGDSPEPAYRALMTARRGLGDLAGVAEAFHRCEADLRQDLGVEPSRETAELFVRLSDPDAPFEVKSEPHDVVSAHAQTIRAAGESPPPPQEIRFCTAKDGVRIAYALVGNGPPLLKAANYLSHLEFDWRTPFGDIYRSLAERYTLIRYDERGNGLSDWDAEDFSFEAWVGDMEAVADAAGFERFPLLGISQGGAVAVAYAARHPDRVSHLIVLGGYARGWLNRDLTPELEEERQTLLSLMKLGWGTGHQAFQRVFSMQIFPGATPEELRWLDDLQGVSATAENAFRLESEMHRADVRDLLPDLKVPTLVLHSRGDLGVPFEEGRLLARSLHDARFVPLESDNHIPMKHEPAWRQMIEAIHQFIGAEKSSS